MNEWYVTSFFSRKSAKQITVSSALRYDIKRWVWCSKRRSCTTVIRETWLFRWRCSCGSTFTVLGNLSNAICVFYGSASILFSSIRNSETLPWHYTNAVKCAFLCLIQNMQVIILYNVHAAFYVFMRHFIIIYFLSQ